MSMPRRTFLVGAASGLGLLALSGCAPEKPRPTPRPTSSSPAPTGEPADVVRSRWSSDPFARGAVSFLPVGATPELRAVLAEPVEGRVFFAGEATADTDAGTVLGARASGERAATEILQEGSADETVFVIGAGIAGATAARRLSDYGFTVRVIEARDRTGGRIVTGSGDDEADEQWPLPIQLGPSRLRGGDAESLGEDLESAGGEVRDVDAEVGILQLDGSEVAAGDSGPDALAAARTAADEGLRDVSLSDALDDAGVSPDAAAAAFLGSTVVDVLGGETDRVSTWYGLEELPADDAPFVAGGWSELVDEALDGIDVSLGAVVTSVVYREDGVSLRFSSGESLSADRVLVTVPLGVLKDDGFSFSPRLPFEKRTAIDALGVGRVETIWMRFDEVAWTDERARWNVVDPAALDPDSDSTSTDDVAVGPRVLVADWINLDAVTGDPVLIGIVGGDAAEAFAKLDDDAARATALASLAPFLARG